MTLGFGTIRRTPFESLHAIVEFADIFQEGVVLLVFADRLGWGTEHDGVRWHIFGEARHRADHDLVADLNVAAEADFSSKGDIVANAGATRDADLRAKDAMLANGHIVADLDEV
ncbi:MAG: hypothetical protein ACK559_42100, partial [bacterium]